MHIGRDSREKTVAEKTLAESMARGMRTEVAWERAALIDALAFGCLSQWIESHHGKQKAGLDPGKHSALAARGPWGLPLLVQPLVSRSHQVASPTFLFVQEINLKVDYVDY